MKLFIILIALPIAVLAQSDSLECYMANKADALITAKGGEFVFETFDGWELAGNPPDVLDRRFKWIFRDAGGNTMNDAEMLSWAGREESAERMREMYRDWRNKGNLRLMVGVPLGLAMIAVGGYWHSQSTDVDDPSALDKTGPLVLMGAGVGVNIGAIYSFIDTRQVKPKRHEMTGRQALELLDRHNRLTAIECGAD
ncbi:MAG TPA: hypothetical protein ENN07_01185 [candidate division Zixibacteria bacterium]|nr:hypothetical protein [candidate division Zixibacteria bacterium]